MLSCFCVCPDHLTDRLNMDLSQTHGHTMAESLKAILLPYQERIERELRQFARFPGPASLRDPISYFFTLPGKRIRTLITLITAEQFCSDYEDAVPAAVAIEVLHDFT